MKNVYPPQPEPPAAAPRFNVLLAEHRRPAAQHWTDQMAQLLQPQGVHAFVAHCGQQAIELAGTHTIHAAVIDLATPTTADDTAASSTAANHRGPGGLWVLEIISRMPNRPPVVLVNSSAISTGQVQRILDDALRLGAFSVVNRPIELNAILAVFQRLVERTYAGAWPATNPPPHSH